MAKSILNQLKKHLLFLLFLLFSLSLVQAQKSILKGTITFEFVSKKVDGGIGGFTSSSTIDMENIVASHFEGSVTVESIKTGNFLRDWALKGGKYFDQDKYPRIKFKSSLISSEDDRIKVDGDLTIKETTKPITIYFTVSQNTLIGTTTLFSSDFGVQIKKKREDNKVEVILRLALE